MGIIVSYALPTQLNRLGLLVLPNLLRPLASTKERRLLGPPDSSSNLDMELEGSVPSYDSSVAPSSCSEGS